MVAIQSILFNSVHDKQRYLSELDGHSTVMLTLNSAQQSDVLMHYSCDRYPACYTLSQWQEHVTQQSLETPTPFILVLLYHCCPDPSFLKTYYHTTDALIDLFRFWKSIRFNAKTVQELAQQPSLSIYNQTVLLWLEQFEMHLALHHLVPTHPQPIPSSYTRMTLIGFDYHYPHVKALMASDLGSILTVDYCVWTYGAPDSMGDYAQAQFTDVTQGACATMPHRSDLAADVTDGGVSIAIDRSVEASENEVREPAIVGHRYQTMDQEVATALRDLVERCHHDSTLRWDQCVIGIPDTGDYAPLIQRYGAALGIPISVTESRSLGLSNVAQFLFRFLAMLVPNAAPLTLVHFLKGPLTTRFQSDPIDCGDVIRRIHDHPTLTIDAWLTDQPEPIWVYLRTLIHQPYLTVTEFVDMIQQVMTDFHLLEQVQDDVDVLASYYRVLGLLGEFCIDVGELLSEPSIETLIRSLTTTIVATIVPNGTRIGVRVVPLSQAFGLRASVMYMMGLTQSQFPPPANQDAFLNRQLRVPQVQVPASFYDALVMGYHRHSQTRFSMPHYSQDGQIQYPTALIETIQDVDSIDLPITVKDRQLANPKPLSDTCMQDRHSGEPTAVVYSASQLELYQQCPQKYWYRYQLGLEESLDDDQLYAQQWGMSVHSILDHFFSQLSPAQAIQFARTPRQFSPMLESVMRECISGAALPPYLAANFIQKWVGNEDFPGVLMAYLTHLDDLPFQLEPLRSEHKFGPMSLDTVSGPMMVKGTIDLVCRIVDTDTYVVLDFKTGKQLPTKADIQAGRSCQLPLYMIAARRLDGVDRVIGSLYTQLDSYACRSVVMTCETEAKQSVFGLRRERPVNQSDAYFESFVTHMGDVARQIESHAMALPDTFSGAACRLCAFKLQCRYPGRFQS